MTSAGQWWGSDQRAITGALWRATLRRAGLYADHPSVLWSYAAHTASLTTPTTLRGTEPCRLCANFPDLRLFCLLGGRVSLGFMGVQRPGLTGVHHSNAAVCHAPDLR